MGIDWSEYARFYYLNLHIVLKKFRRYVDSILVNTVFFLVKYRIFLEIEFPEKCSNNSKAFEIDMYLRSLVSNLSEKLMLFKFRSGSILM